MAADVISSPSSLVNRVPPAQEKRDKIRCRIFEALADGEVSIDKDDAVTSTLSVPITSANTPR